MKNMTMILLSFLFITTCREILIASQTKPIMRDNVDRKMNNRYLRTGKNLPIIFKKNVLNPFLAGGYKSGQFYKKNFIKFVQLETIHSNNGVNYKKAHKYLGYSTVILAGAAAVSSSNRSIHYGTAYAASGAALFTCLTGYIAYRNYIKLSNGLFSGVNSHVSLGVLGTIGFTTAVIMADSGNKASHASIGGSSAASMLISLVVIKW